MGQLKRLAGDTAIYGISSILGRSINYLLVFIHTSVFNPDALGIITVLYSFVAFFNVIYTFGMETAFFRFINKTNDNATYEVACTAVLLISTFFSGLIIIFSEELTLLSGYEGVENLIIWLAIILWIDGILAIPFARIRQENKARLFATVKVGNILINVILQIFFLWILPNFHHLPILNSIYNEELGIGYIILANLIANALFIPFLWRYISAIRLNFSFEFLKPMAKYSTPIMIMGLAGMINEMMGNIMLEYLLPLSFYDNMTSTDAVGVYGQTFKLSTFMMLAIQAFRYAGEPFFFNSEKEKNAPELFARVFHYFVLFCLLMLVVISINVDLLAQIFLRKPEFRVALYLVPILLLGKLFYGMYINLNIWFKLKEKTAYGTYYSILGATVTIIGNLLLIPVLGFLGTAIVTVLCYLSMTIACYYTGKKYYPIPYNFNKILPYFIIGLGLVAASYFIHHPVFWIDAMLRMVASLAIVIVMIALEKPSSIKKTSDY